MNAQHTPGTWFPVQHGTEQAYWMVMRDLLESGGRCEFMKGEDGRAAEFPTLDAARAAIAKTTGSEA